jgi:prophage regulatory protein
MEPQARFIKRQEVLRRVPFSAATLRRQILDGRFPAPVKISERSTAWVAAEVDAWLDARAAARESAK